MNSDKAEKLQENLFLTAYIMWMLYGILHITLWRSFELVPTIYEYLRKTAFVLLFVRFLLKKRYTGRDIAGIFLMILACVLALHSVHNKEIIPVAIFACCAEGIDYKKILRTTLILQAGIMVVTIAASQTGTIEDIIWNQWDAETASTRVRHSLGYNYCGYPAHLLFFMTLIWFCVRKRFTILDVTLCAALNYAMYKMTDSRTDFYLVILAIVGMFIWSRPYRNRPIRAVRNFITKSGFFFAAVFSIAMQLLYKQEIPWMSALNIKLSNRLLLGSQAIHQYGFSLLGSKIRWFGQGSLRADPTKVYNYVDNAFLKETLSYGVLFLIVLVILFYFTGRQIAKKEVHAVGWAMLMTFAYAILNAHLFELTFNAFALLPGMMFDSKEEPAAESLPDGMAGLKLQRIHPLLRRGLRVALMFSILGYAVLIQMSGTKYLVNYALMHAWVVSGALFALAVLCCDNGKDLCQDREECADPWLLRVVLLFFVLAFVSDFFVAKKFRYSAFCALAFGGAFVQAWRRMKEPEQLLQEFKWAYKLIFVAVLVGSAVLRPVEEGAAYKGIFTSASSLGIAALIALTVFLSDCRGKVYGVVNGAGALAAAYVIWLTQKPMTAASAIAVLAYWLCHVLLHAREERRSSDRAVKILPAAAAVALGAAVAFGACMVLKNGTLTDAIRTRLWLAKEYLFRMNLTGNRYLAEIAEKTRWPQNSIVMNMYRYGIPAGLVYLARVALCFWRMIWNEFQRRDFFPAILAFTCLIVTMTETVEMPFVQLGWIASGFSLVWMFVKPKEKQKRKT